MDTKKILLLGAGGLLLAKVLSDNKSNGNVGDWSPTELPQTTGEEETGGGPDIFSREGREYEINYDSWKSKDWLGYVKNLVAGGRTLDDAMSIAYGQFNVPRNPYRDLVPSYNAFLVLIARSERIPISVSAEVAGIGYNGSQQFIEWDSMPLYDNFDAWTNGLPVWSCDNWIDWHRALENHYNSTSKANQIWLNAWNSPSHNPDCWAFMCPDTSYCRYDCESFVNYLASKDIPVGNLLSNVSCDLSNVILNVTEGVSQASEITKVGISLLPLLGAYIGYRYLKNRKLV